MNKDRIKFRYHRGVLDESMATTILVESKHELKSLLLDEMGFLKKNAYGIEVEPYAHDERIGWDTHIVSIILPGGIPKVVGFTDGPIND